MAAMDKAHFKRLERKIDELLDLCQDLKRENTELKARESAWLQERHVLVEKTELAKGRVAAMITRLKALEQES